MRDRKYLKGQGKMQDGDVTGESGIGRMAAGSATAPTLVLALIVGPAVGMAQEGSDGGG